MEVKLNWILSYVCNRRCSYCYIDKQSVVLYGKAYYYSIIESIKRLWGDKNSFFLALLGGEPTCVPHIVDIVNQIKLALPCVSLRMISNGDADIELYRELNKIIDDFIISIHLEQYNEQVLDILSVLNHVEVHIMELKSKRNIQSLVDSIPIDKTKIKIMPLHSRQPRKDKSKVCLQGYNTFELLPNGNLKGAICSNAPIIGNIKRLKTVIPTRISCNQACLCLSNNRIPKYYV